LNLMKFVSYKYTSRYKVVMPGRLQVMYSVHFCLTIWNAVNCFSPLPYHLFPIRI
jgi:hypothetical protein